MIPTGPPARQDTSRRQAHITNFYKSGRDDPFL